MRSRSSSPNVNSMSDPSYNPLQGSSKPTSDLGSKKQDLGHARPRHTSSSSGAKQKRPPKTNNNHGHPAQFKHGGGRRSHGGRGFPKSTSSKEMMTNASPDPLMLMNTNNDAEMGSVYKMGSKKSNYNHLLNFDYGPQRGVNDVSRRAPKETMKKKQTSSRFKYTKEHYLQANCQFLVRQERDYSEHIGNPDLPLEWENIEMATLKTNDHPSCPICLYQPKTAKMTRCGHIYCWQCILHYLALSDDDWRKCPICEECICKQDLKSVVTVPFSELAIGEEIEMDLMRRNRASMFAYPLSKYKEEYEGKYPNLNQGYNSYSRIVLASPEEIISHIIDKEKQTLLECYEYERDEPESCFILEALNSLEERSKKLQLEADALNNLPFIEKLSLTPGAAEASSFPPSFENLRANLEFEHDFPNSRSSTLMNATPARKEFFNFYQSSDGQKIFLHGLNAKMLERQFGDLKDAPTCIKGKILEKEVVTVTEELRSKFRYLRHLPLLCNIEFVELDLTSIDFDKAVLEEFKQQIDDRKKKRNRKARDERKREKKIMIEENKLMGKYPDPNYRIESNYHFPDIGHDMSLGRTANGQNDDNNGVTTFAKVIRQGGSQHPRINRSETFPSLGAIGPSQLPSAAASSSGSAWTSGNAQGGGVLSNTYDSNEDPSSFVPEKPSLNLDLSTGVVVVKNKKGKKKGKNMVMLSSAPRPMI